MDSGTVESIRSGLGLLAAFRGLFDLMRGLRRLRFETVYEFEGLSGLSDAYFGGALRDGDLVTVACRFSKYGHCYVPSSMYGASGIADIGGSDNVNHLFDPSGVSILARPAVPMSTLPPIDVEGTFLSVGYIYPPQCRGADLFDHLTPRSIPILFRSSSEVSKWEAGVVTLTARVCAIPPEFESQYRAIMPAESEALLGLWYRPWSPTSPGFCLTLLDDDLSRDSRCSLQFPSDTGSVPLAFTAVWPVEYHLDGIDLTELSTDRQRYAFCEYVGVMLRGVVDARRTLGRSGQGSFGMLPTRLDYLGCYGRWGVRITEPNHLVVLCAVDLMTEYETCVRAFPGICKELVASIVTCSKDLTGRTGTAELDFLYDFRHQWNFSDAGALASRDAKYAIDSTKVFENVREFWRV